MLCSTPEEAIRKERERQSMHEGIQIWKRHKEEQTAKNWEEKKEVEVRRLLEQYWPWGRPGGGAPNSENVGLKNMYGQGVFPEEDMQRAKRQVGVFQFGRPQPVHPHAPRQVRFKEDPALRFQWGQDLRRQVDNTLRYRSRREDQDKYRKQLDAMIEERRRAKEHERMKKLEFERKMVQTNESAMRRHKEEQLKEKDMLRKDYDRHKHKHEERKEHRVEKRGRLSPPHKNGSGVELVPLIARRRVEAVKLTLGSTDVTRGDAEPRQWKANEPQYLKDLTQQVDNKHKRIKEARAEEIETSRRHFETWGSLWGRPGHGAPRSATYKGRLDMMMIYPQQMSVH